MSETDKQDNEERGGWKTCMKTVH